MSRLERFLIALNLFALAGYLTAALVVTPAGGNVPTGALIISTSSSCPTGYNEYTTARGRYIVGTPASGTNGGTQGTALTDLENRAVGQHNHGITDSGHVHGVSDPGHTHVIVAFSGGANNDAIPTSAGTDGTSTNRATNSATTSISVNNAGTGITVNNTGTTAGTNAPYLQHLYCQKS